MGAKEMNSLRTYRPAQNRKAVYGKRSAAVYAALPLGRRSSGEGDGDDISASTRKVERKGEEVARRQIPTSTLTSTSTSTSDAIDTGEVQERRRRKKKLGERRTHTKDGVHTKGNGAVVNDGGIDIHVDASTEDGNGDRDVLRMVEDMARLNVGNEDEDLQHVSDLEKRRDRRRRPLRVTDGNTRTSDSEERAAPNRKPKPGRRKKGKIDDAPVGQENLDEQGHEEQSSDSQKENRGLEEIEEPVKLRRSPRKHPDQTLAPSTPNAPPTCSPARQPRQQTPSVFTEHCSPLLALSTHGIIPFADWAAQISDLFSVSKIAEASFGEVYRLSLLEHFSDFDRSDESVIKIIALQPPESLLPRDKRRRAAARKRAQDMSSPVDVATEVRLLQRMTAIPGFTNFRDIRIVQGRPPPAFIHAFHTFNEAQVARGKEGSVFPDPEASVSYPSDQLWAVVEMQDAGNDLERYVEDGKCTSIWSVWDVFWQATLALAKGEEGAEFEHRDLHLGNLCIRPQGSLYSSSSCSHIPSSDCTQKQQENSIDLDRKLNFTHIETTLIDYTLSRACMPDNSIAHVDLARDPSLFMADSSEEYQFEIYRYMRGAVLLDDPLADFSSRDVLSRAAIATRVPRGGEGDEMASRSWDKFHPVTNLLWLHFVLHMLLEQVTWPSSMRRPASRSKTQRMAYMRWKRAVELERILLRVQDFMLPETVCENEEVKNAKDLVAMALSEGWLDVCDVVGEDIPEEEDIPSEIDEKVDVTRCDGDTI